MAVKKPRLSKEVERISRLLMDEESLAHFGIVNTLKSLVQAYSAGKDQGILSDT